MATATPPPVAATSVAEQSSSGCLDDPNFATICSFMEKFGETCRIDAFPFAELQEMIENTNDVALPLVRLHVSLLRRVFKSIAPDKWERSLAKFGHTYCSQDGWEIERFGYKKAKIQTKLRLLKNLLESQFDYNVKFKAEVNKIPATDLRLIPLGRDTEGQLYWYQVDNDANLRVYREDVDDETWEIVASSREEMVELISQLQRGEVKKPIVADDEVVAEEDANEKEIEPKEILLDTGKIEDEVSEDDVDDEPDWKEDDNLSIDDEAMEIDEDYIAPEQIAVDDIAKSNDTKDNSNSFNNVSDSFSLKEDNVDISTKNNALEIKKYESYTSVSTTSYENLDKNDSKVEPLRLVKDKIKTVNFNVTQEQPIQNISESKINEHIISSVDSYNEKETGRQGKIAEIEEMSEKVGPHELNAPLFIKDDNIQKLKPEYVPVTKDEITSSSPCKSQSFEKETEQPLLLSSKKASNDEIKTEPISIKENVNVSPDLEIPNPNALIVTKPEQHEEYSHPNLDSTKLSTSIAKTTESIKESGPESEQLKSQPVKGTEPPPVSVELSISISEAPSNPTPSKKSIANIVQNLKSAVLSTLPEAVKNVFPGTSQKSFTEERGKEEIEKVIPQTKEPSIFSKGDSPNESNDQQLSVPQNKSQPESEKLPQNAELPSISFPMETKIQESSGPISVSRPSLDLDEIESNDDDMEIAEDIYSEDLSDDTYPSIQEPSEFESVKDEKNSFSMFKSFENSPATVSNTSVPCYTWGEKRDTAKISEVHLTNVSDLSMHRNAYETNLVQPKRITERFDYKTLASSHEEKEDLIIEDLAVAKPGECMQQDVPTKRESISEILPSAKSNEITETSVVSGFSTCTKLGGTSSEIKVLEEVRMPKRDLLSSSDCDVRDAAAFVHSPSSLEIPKSVSLHKTDTPEDFSLHKERPVIDIASDNVNLFDNNINKEFKVSSPHEVGNKMNASPSNIDISQYVSTNEDKTCLTKASLDNMSFPKEDSFADTAQDFSSNKVANLKDSSGVSSLQEDSLDYAESPGTESKADTHKEIYSQKDHQLNLENSNLSSVNPNISYSQNYLYNTDIPKQILEPTEKISFKDIDTSKEVSSEIADSPKVASLEITDIPYAVSLENTEISKDVSSKSSDHSDTLKDAPPLATNTLNDVFPESKTNLKEVSFNNAHSSKEMDSLGISKEISLENSNIPKDVFFCKDENTDVKSEGVCLENTDILKEDYVKSLHIPKDTKSYVENIEDSSKDVIVESADIPNKFSLENTDIPRETFMETTDIPKEASTENTGIPMEISTENTCIPMEISAENTNIPKEVSEESTNVPQEVSEENTNIPKEVSEENTNITKEVSEENTNIPKEVSEENTVVPKEVSEENTIPKEVPEENTIPKEVPEENTIPKKISEENTNISKEVYEENTGVPKEVSEETTNIPQEVSEETTNIPQEVSEETTNIPQEVSAGNSSFPKEVLAENSVLPSELFTKNTNIPKEVSAENANTCVRSNKVLLEKAERHEDDLEKVNEDSTSLQSNVSKPYNTPEKEESYITHNWKASLDKAEAFPITEVPMDIDSDNAGIPKQLPSEDLNETEVSTENTTVKNVSKITDFDSPFSEATSSNLETNSLINMTPPIGVSSGNTEVQKELSENTKSVHESPLPNTNLSEKISSKIHQSSSSDPDFAEPSIVNCPSATVDITITESPLNVFDNSNAVPLDKARTTDFPLPDENNTTEEPPEKSKVTESHYYDAEVTEVASAKLPEMHSASELSEIRAATSEQSEISQMFAKDQSNEPIATSEQTEILVPSSEQLNDSSKRSEMLESIPECSESEATQISSTSGADNVVVDEHRKSELLLDSSENLNAINPMEVESSVADSQPSDEKFSKEDKLFKFQSETKSDISLATTEPLSGSNLLPFKEEDTKNVDNKQNSNCDDTSELHEHKISPEGLPNKSEESLKTLENEKPILEIKKEPEPPCTKPEQIQTLENPDLQINQPMNSAESSSQKIVTPKPVISGLVGYEYSSSEDEESEDIAGTNIQLVSSDVGLKRKAESPLESVAKIPKIGESIPPVVPFNPIVGETIEEDLMTIEGQGSGAANEGGNNEQDVEANESITLEENVQPPVEVKRRGRGRPKKNPGGTTPITPKVTPLSSEKRTNSDHTPKTPTARVRKRELENLNISFEGSGEMNGGDLINDRPVRASRRIAQIRQKEEEERRKLEEEKLAQLKAAQIRKQQKQLEREKNKLDHSDDGSDRPKNKKLSIKNNKNKEYLPDPESESDSEEGEGEDGDDYELKPSKLKKRRRRRNKNGKGKKGGNPWVTSSSEDDEAVEEEEEYHYEEEEEELVFNKSDHEFSPESDMGEEDDASPSRHARTAKRGEEIVDKYAETYCDKCGKGDHPEWILLCDMCDKGWHASCIRPQLWVIPEGQWFCPPCQHNTLIEKLNENLIEYEKILKRRENEVLRKQRLAYVGISLDNVLPGGAPILEKEEKEEFIEKTEKQERQDRYNQRERKNRRRRIDSDDEDDDMRGDDFINDDDSDKDSQFNSSADESDEPIYKLRARRATKSFNFKEYDDMINSALRVDDEMEIDGLETLEVDGEVEKKPEARNGKGKLMDDEEESEEQESDPGGKVDENGEVSKVRKRILMSAKRTSSDEPTGKKMLDEDTDEEELDEKEKNRRKELLKHSQRKTKRRLNDLDAPSDEDEDSDEDFQGSGGDDDEDDEEEAIEDDSEWSGDRDADESDDSIQRGARNKKQGRLGRREKYLEVGTVRRSTRRRKARISYDESDEEGDEEGSDKWQSDETEESESNSESEDETWGKKKKKKTFNPPKSKFFQGNPFQSKPKPKKKKRKVDDDDVDRAWNSTQSSKAKKLAQEPVERRTRGRKINFKDILDSGESDDDGNIRPKRRRILSDSDSDSDAPTSSRKLIEEIKAQNAREAAMHAAKSILSDEKLQLEEKQAAAAASAVVLPEPKPATPPIPPATVPKPSVVPPPLKSDSSAASSKGRSRSNSPNEKSQMEIEMAMAKPVPAPPFPPALAKALGRKSTPSPGLLGSFSSAIDNNINLLPPLGQPLPAHPPVSLSSSPTHPLQLSHSPSNSPSSLSLSLPLTSPSSQTPPQRPPSRTSKKNSSHNVPAPPKGSLAMPPAALTPPKPSISPQQQQILPPGIRANLPSDIARLGNPALYASNPSLRPFHPAWRNSVPPQYGNPGAGMPNTSIGKPPPLSGPPFSMSQQGPPRPGYPSPPPLRIPNPGNSPLQAFQQFKRDPIPPPGMPMYRMPPSSQQGGGPLPGILPPNMAALNQGPPDRYFGGPPGSPYGHPPYGLPPPHNQSQPPSIFPPFDYRIQHLQRPSEPFKEEPPPAQSQPPANEPSSPPPASTVINTTKEDPPAQGDGEFGGLVSYFSSQRSNEEDLDT